MTTQLMHEMDKETYDKLYRLLKQGEVALKMSRLPMKDGSVRDVFYLKTKEGKEFRGLSVCQAIKAASVDEAKEEITVDGITYVRKV